MSHVTKIETIIDDLSSLEQACKLLGLELVREQKTHKWFGQFLNDWSVPEAAIAQGFDPKDFGKCEHAIRVKGNSDAYEIGLVKNPKGPGYVMIYDVWAGGGGLLKVIGPTAGNLRREYAIQVGMKRASREGFRVERIINPATSKPRMRAWRG